MKPHYLRSENTHRDRWMVSYMDVLTILLIFFVAIAAQSLEQAKAKSTPTAASPNSTATVSTAASVTAASATAASAGASPVATPVNETPVVTPAEKPAPDPHAGLAAVQQKLEKQNLDVHLEPRGLVISLPQAVLFASGEDRISKSALPMVSQLAAVLKDIPNQVSLVGHADAIPIHNRHFKNNWELSAARSLQLLELLTSRYGMDESRLSVASYGSYDPKGPNDTPDGRANNRRVEIVILDAAIETAGENVVTVHAAAPINLAKDTSAPVASTSQTRP